MGLTNVMSRSLLSAQMSLKTAKVQHSVKKQMDGQAGVLRAEIKQDGGNKKKEEDLKEVEAKAVDLENTQMNLLSGMNDDLKKAARADAEEQMAEKAAEKKRAEKTAEKKKAQKEEQEERIEKIRTKTDTEVADTTDHVEALATVSGAESIDVTSDATDVSVKSSGNIGVKVDIKT